MLRCVLESTKLKCSHVQVAKVGSNTAAVYVLAVKVTEGHVLRLFVTSKIADHVHRLRVQFTESDISSR